MSVIAAREPLRREKADEPVALSLRVAGKGRVDRAKRVEFTFDGRSVDAFQGDTVASALLASGVRLVGRSFKYHRPRGIVTAGSEEPNALLGIQRGKGRTEPNVRATMQEVFGGLETFSQNRWPSLAFDVGAINDKVSRALPAGFYYKTVRWPIGFWDRVYEPVIRRAAGLGTAPNQPDPDRYAARYAHADVLVVGGGPAGLAAALSAGRAGADVILVDEHREAGGALLSSSATVDGLAASRFADRVLAELDTLANVRVLTRTTAIAHDHQNMVMCVERLTDHMAAPPEGAPRERLWRVRAAEVVLAQGAVERPLVFSGNDRPGVMLAGAALTYLERFGVLVGREAVIATTNDSAYRTAFALADAGVSVPAIVDARPSVAEDLTAAAKKRGITVMKAAQPAVTRGRHRVTEVGLSNGVRLKCDALLMCGGWTPSVHLHSHTKGKLHWTGEAFIPAQTPERCRSAGAGAGNWGLEAALSSGASAGVEAAKTAGFKGAKISFAVEGEREDAGTPPAPGVGKKAFVDFQNDVTAKDIRQAVGEGMRSIEHVKRYTTNGMATDQGKTSNINALVIAAEALQKSPPDVGLTTFRPPFTPVTFGTLANHHRGAGFTPLRKTAIDGWAATRGAVFEPVGEWRRARFFPQGDETMDAAVRRECRDTRRIAGLFDASTLGKIEVVGPDAAEFLNRMYTNPLLKLQNGRCRYVVLLGEDGFIRDDGIVARLANDRFHVTTTTGGAARVLAMMEDYLQTEWPELEVALTSTTEQYGAIALNGPRAREILDPLVDADLSAETLPHMSILPCDVAGARARLMRVSFTGELGFEIHVPTRKVLDVWHALLEAGEPHGMTIYGTEAMHVMRAEKGYIIVGQDTDGTLTPVDAGLSWAIGKKKLDFVGKRSLSRPDMVASGRRELVGLLSEDPSVVLSEGGQIVEDPLKPLPATMIGHVTSAYYSDAVGRSIALAVVEDGRARMGQTLTISLEDAFVDVTVADPVFLDKEGSRLNV